MIELTSANQATINSTQGQDDTHNAMHKYMLPEGLDTLSQFILQNMTTMILPWMMANLHNNSKPQPWKTPNEPFKLPTN